MIQSLEKTTHHIEHCTTKETNCAWLDLTLVYYIFHNTSYFTGVHPNNVDDDMYNLSEKTEPSKLHVYVKLLLTC